MTRSSGNHHEAGPLLLPALFVAASSRALLVPSPLVLIAAAQGTGSTNAVRYRRTMPPNRSRAQMAPSSLTSKAELDALTPKLPNVDVIVDDASMQITSEVISYANVTLVVGLGRRGSDGGR